MEVIETVKQLLKTLSHSEAKEFVSISERLNLSAKDFEAYATWSSKAYTRNCIGRDDHFELLLLCWNPKQITPIHCHNNEECWVLNLQGEFEEVRYDEEIPDSGELMEISREIMSEGGLSYMNDSMGFHSLANLSSERAMSLHLYMNPIDQCRIFDEEKKELVWKSLSYDSVATL